MIQKLIKLKHMMEENSQRTDSWKKPKSTVGWTEEIQRMR